jgi:hypothetical protein
MAFIAVSSKDRDTIGFEYLDYIEIVQLVGYGEGEDIEVRERALRFQADECFCFNSLRFPEDPLADYVIVAVQDAIDGLEPEAGHPQIVGVGADKGDVYLPAPVLVDSAVLSFELLPGFLDCLPCHKSFTSLALGISASRTFEAAFLVCQRAGALGAQSCYIFGTGSSFSFGVLFDWSSCTLRLFLLRCISIDAEVLVPLQHAGDGVST